MGGRVCCLFLYLQSTAFSWCRAREERQDVTSIHLPLPHTMRCGCLLHCPYCDGHLAPAGTAATTSSWAPRCAHAQNNSKLENKQKSKVADFLSGKQQGAAWEGGSEAPCWCHLCGTALGGSRLPLLELCSEVPVCTESPPCAVRCIEVWCPTGCAGSPALCQGSHSVRVEPRYPSCARGRCALLPHVWNRCVLYPYAWGKCVPCPHARGRYNLYPYA